MAGSLKFKKYTMHLCNLCAYVVKGFETDSKGGGNGINLSFNTLQYF